MVSQNVLEMEMASTEKHIFREAEGLLSQFVIIGICIVIIASLFCHCRRVYWLSLERKLV